MSAKISEKQGIQMIMKRDVADHQFICWSCVTLARFTSFNDRKGSENMVLSAGQEVGTNHPRGSSSRNMCDVFFSLSNDVDCVHLYQYMLGRFQPGRVQQTDNLSCGDELLINIPASFLVWIRVFKFISP